MSYQYYRLGSGDHDYWRTDGSRPYGRQVEFQMRDGEWKCSILPTVQAFLADASEVAVAIATHEVPNLHCTLAPGCPHPPDHEVPCETPLDGVSPVDRVNLSLGRGPVRPGHSWIADYAETNARLTREAGYSGDQLTRSVMKVAGEAGEMVESFLRCTGQARRGGTVEEFQAEVADTVLACFVLAAVMGFDLDAAVAAKLTVIYERGWRVSRDA